MTAVIETRGLTKYYGTVRGVDDLDLVVEKGEVFGFIGPNGAGKSTTIRLFLDFIRPTAGAARVLGLDTRADSIEIRRRVGYLPGELAMYERMTGREMLRHFAALRRLDGLGEAVEIAERFDLDLDRRIRSYSSGNRQKLGLVQAFMHGPELLILDEPTNSLDPLIQQDFYTMVDELQEEGHTFFVSSHVLPEVERIADRVGIIRRGRLVVTETVAELKAKAVRRLELYFSEPVGDDAFAALPSVRAAVSHDGGRAIELTITGSVDPVVKLASRYEVERLVSRDGELEEAFLAYYEEDGRAR